MPLLSKSVQVNCVEASRESAYCGGIPRERDQFGNLGEDGLLDRTEIRDTGNPCAISSERWCVSRLSLLRLRRAPDGTADGAVEGTSGETAERTSEQTAEGTADRTADRTAERTSMPGEPSAVSDAGRNGRRNRIPVALPSLSRPRQEWTARRWTIVRCPEVQVRAVPTAPRPAAPPASAHGLRLANRVGPRLRVHRCALPSPDPHRNGRREDSSP
jgi:hypothetical protein